MESLVQLHTTHRKCKKWVLDTYDTGVKFKMKTNSKRFTCIVTIVKRGQFGNPQDFFKKSFKEYEKGFGDEEKGDLT